MKLQTANKSPYSLNVGEITSCLLSGKFEGVSIGRTKKGYHAEISGFKSIVVEELKDLKAEEINRVRTRGTEDYM